MQKYIFILFIKFLQIIFLNLIIIQNLFAQKKQNNEVINLVPNPSFEKLEDCKIYLDEFKKTKEWQGYSFTPDIFNVCSTEKYFTTPDNIFDHQKPHSGSGYAGILTYHRDYPNEIIGVKLLKPLQKGQYYSVSFYASFASQHAQYTSNNLGALFTNNPKNVYNSQKAHIFSEKIITESEKWHEIKAIVLADSNYTHLTIGNFFSKQKTIRRRMPSGMFDASYYFIDDVEVLHLPEYLPKPNDVISTITNPKSENIVENAEVKKNVSSTFSFAGKVFDEETKKPIVASVTYFVPDQNQGETQNTDYLTGTYAFTKILRPERLGVRIQARNYYPLLVSLVPPAEDVRFQKDFYMYPLRPQKDIELTNVKFNADSLLSESFGELNNLASVLNENPMLKVELQHITFQSHDTEQTRKQCLMIKDYLVNIGKIAPERIITRASHQTKSASGSQSEMKNDKKKLVIKILN